MFSGVVTGRFGEITDDGSTVTFYGNSKDKAECAVVRTVELDGGSGLPCCSTQKGVGTWVWKRIWQLPLIGCGDTSLSVDIGGMMEVGVVVGRW